MPSGRPPGGLQDAGELLDAMGLKVRLRADCDAVLVTVGRSTAILGLDERDAFIRGYFEAERQAEAWAIEHAGVSDGG